MWPRKKSVVSSHGAGSTNYEEIATYDNMQNPQLLAKPYSGHEYSYTDSMVPPGGLIARESQGEVFITFCQANTTTACFAVLVMVALQRLG